MIYCSSSINEVTENREQRRDKKAKNVLEPSYLRTFQTNLLIILTTTHTHLVVTVALQEKSETHLLLKCVASVPLQWRKYNPDVIQ